MLTKSANLYARIEPEVKEKAERILSILGIPASRNLIVIKYHKDELHRSKEWKNMMYPDGKVKVYIETPDETGGFHDAICWLPDYTWEVHGYSESWCILNNLLEIMHT